MRYNKLTEGVFLRRPNRFLAHVLVDGRIVEDGDASLVDEINENGFERFEQM